MNAAVKYTLAGIAAVILGFVSLGIIHPEIEYESRVQISAPVTKAFDIFIDTSMMKHWMPGFVSFKPLEGKMLTKGSKQLLVLNLNNEQIEITETVEDYSYPKFYKFHAQNTLLNSTNTIIFEGDSIHCSLTVKTKASGNNFMLRSMFVFTEPIFKQQQDSTYTLLKRTIESHLDNHNINQ
ncbi:MAG TPA: SRPBCC family protein [Bacteroidia bacterium]|nr:SRPBCC family protein [Bacteroidia bacterium]QQR96005.1 MAG: SRPBCC family protein [Bacteroidota bacterium]MBP7713596.1 SRPBCC family protein [Bacteroidia bacterium]MBP8667673.1 SRPBCC family protein [Bacteroidia bacterium]HOZ81310.1 SRPBCC family protein [Bacteroidia bacterium]